MINIPQGLQALLHELSPSGWEIHEDYRTSEIVIRTRTDDPKIADKVKEWVDNQRPSKMSQHLKYKWEKL